MHQDNIGAEPPRVAMSMWGTIAGLAWHPQEPPLGGPQDRFMLEWLRSQADLLLYGAGTVRVERGRGGTDTASVRTWQPIMRDWPWPIGVDEMCGSGPEVICRQFQAMPHKNLRVNGLVGSSTWAASW